MLFARLSIFVGGWTLAAAEGICAEGNDDAVDVLDGLQVLHDQSLIRQYVGKNGETRYTMLETIREYARVLLAQQGEELTLGLHHLTYYAEALESLAEERRASYLDPHGWEEVDDDHLNFLFALEFAVRNDQATLGLRLATVIGRFLWRSQDVRLAVAWTDALLALSDNQVPSRVRARALNGASAMSWCLIERQSAQSYAEESLNYFQSLDDKQGIADILQMLGRLASERNDIHRAWALLQDALNLHRLLGNEQEVVRTQALLAEITFFSFGDVVGARALIQESLDISRRVNNTGTSWHLWILGLICRDEGDLTQARSHLEEALRLIQPSKFYGSIITAQINLAWVAIDQGDFQRARGLLVDCLARARQADPPDLYQLSEALRLQTCMAQAENTLDDVRRLAMDVLDIAPQLVTTDALLLFIDSIVLFPSMQPQDVIVLIAATVAWRHRERCSLPPGALHIQNKMLDGLHQHIGASEFERLWACGQVMMYAEVVEFARQAISRIA